VCCLCGERNANANSEGQKRQKVKVERKNKARQRTTAVVISKNTPSLCLSLLSLSRSAWRQD